MLVLSRRPGEEVLVASNIRVTMLGIQGNSVKLGFSAPEDVAIFRSELLDRAHGDTEREVTVEASKVVHGPEQGDVVKRNGERQIAPWVLPASRDSTADAQMRADQELH